MADIKVGNPLGEVLWRSGFTVNQIAQAGNCSPEVVRNWINGHRKPGTDTAKLLASNLGIPLHKLRPDVWTPEMSKLHPLARSRRRFPPPAQEE